MAETLRIGSRGSELALWQARFVQTAIGGEIVVIKTQGDKITHLSLDKVEGKGFFTKEIEAALLEERIDVAVHSYKDLPTDLTEGLTVAAVPKRASTHDVLVSRAAASLEALPRGARVGTSSLRRKASLKALRADLELVDLRGNVPTRVNKVREGALDAVIAAAGLERLQLDLEGLHLIALSPEQVCPAAAQGALAVQVRANDTATLQRVSVLNDEPSERAVAAERSLLARFGGGCHLPLGVSCRYDGTYDLFATVTAPDGQTRMLARAKDTDMAKAVSEAHRALAGQGAERYL